MCQSKADGGKRCAARIDRNRAAADGRTESAVKPGYFTPHPYEEGEAHRPPAVAPTPDRTLSDRVHDSADIAGDAVRNLLDVVIAIWHKGYGEVLTAFGINANELVYGETVKGNLERDLTTDAREKFGEDTTVRIATDVGVNRVHVSVVGPDGSTHQGFARAATDDMGCVKPQELTWDPPTTPTTAAPASWAAGMTGAAVTKVPRPATAPTKPATSWAAGMAGATVVKVPRVTPAPAEPATDWTEGMRH